MNGTEIKETEQTRRRMEDGKKSLSRLVYLVSFRQLVALISFDNSMNCCCPVFIIDTEKKSFRVGKVLQQQQETMAEAGLYDSFSQVYFYKNSKLTQERERGKDRLPITMIRAEVVKEM